MGSYFSQMFAVFFLKSKATLVQIVLIMATVEIPKNRPNLWDQINLISWPLPLPIKMWVLHKFFSLIICRILLVLCQI